MARLLTLDLDLKSGTIGLEGPVRIRINGHILPLIRREGSTAPRDRFRGTAEIGSVVHTLELLGPSQGSWDVERMNASFRMSDDSMHGHELGPLRLGAGEAVNIWVSSDSFSV